MAEPSAYLPAALGPPVRKLERANSKAGGLSGQLLMLGDDLAALRWRLASSIVPFQENLYHDWRHTPMLVMTRPVTKGLAPAYLRLYESGELAERVDRGPPGAAVLRSLPA